MNPLNSPVTMIQCGGARRTDRNPFGWRSHDREGNFIENWFTNRALDALRSGAFQAMFHQPLTTWAAPTESRNGQQGAVFESSPFVSMEAFEDLRKAVRLLAFNGVPSGIYMSCEFKDGGGFRPGDHANPADTWYFGDIINSIAFCGFQSVWLDRASQNERWVDAVEGYAATKNLIVVREALQTYAIPPRTPTWRHRNYICLDQFMEKRMDAVLASPHSWRVPNGTTVHVIERIPGLLAPEDWDFLATIGYTRGQVLPPSLSETP